MHIGWDACEKMHMIRYIGGFFWGWDRLDDYEIYIEIIYARVVNST